MDKYYNTVNKRDVKEYSSFVLLAFIPFCHSERSLLVLREGGVEESGWMQK